MGLEGGRKNEQARERCKSHNEPVVVRSRIQVSLFFAVRQPFAKTACDSSSAYVRGVSCSAWRYVSVINKLVNRSRKDLMSTGEFLK